MNCLLPNCHLLLILFFVLFFYSLSIRLFDLDTGKCSKKLNGSHSAKVSMLDFSGNGKYLVSASSNVRMLNLFSVEKNELIHSFSLLNSPLQISVSSYMNEFTSVISSGEGGVIEVHRFFKEDLGKVEKQSVETKKNGEPCNSKLLFLSL